jgi:hypothetical protein
MLVPLLRRDYELNKKLYPFKYPKNLRYIDEHIFDVTTSYNSVDRAAWLGKVTSQRHA